MRKLIAFIFILVLVQTGQAQVSKTMVISTAGTLSTALTANELATVTNLTLTGTIDARDFVTLRDAMPLLSSLDISGVIIAAYDGTAGPANVKVSSTSAINEPEKVELDDDPLRNISAQHIKMQTKTATTTTYPANEIPKYAFYNPTTGNGKLSLKSIVLPNSITSIGSTAFTLCTGLTSITIPTLVTNIGSDAFYNCIGLTSITIPVSVTTIGIYAFAYCTGLTSIIIPASVTTIGSYAFSYCTGLTSIYANSSLPINISASRSVFYKINTTTCTLYVPQGSKAAYQAANQWKDFTNIVENNTTVSKTLQVNTAGTLASLLTVNELATVTNLTLTGNIDTRDFKTMRDNMPVLANINLSGVNIVAYTGVEGTYSTSNTVYPGNEIPAYAFYNPTTWKGKVSLKSIALPNSSTSIGSNAFGYCTGLTSISIPASVSSTGERSFFECTGLSSISVPATVTTIGELSFFGCGLINVDNGNPNYSSQEGVLYNKLKTQIIQCPDLKTGSFSIPVSVTSIENYAFWNCKVLTSITIPASVSSIGIQAFWYCTGLTSITIPSSVSTIGSYGFYYCNGLSSITVPASVSSIGECAFSNCGLINVDNGNPNYSSQDGVLYNKQKTQLIQCPPLKTGSFSIPNSVTLIGDYAFFYCNGLTSITIPLNVTHIGEDAFRNCTSLTTITIPASATSIGSYAFSSCTGLTSIYANSITPVDLTNKNNVFLNINKSTCTLYVPQGSKAAYQAAYQWKDFTNIVENITSVSKTLQVNTAGTLASLLTANELATVTNLTLTGTIDARDFVTLRDAMPLLSSLDISGVTIAAYDGTAGTSYVKASMTPVIKETDMDNDPQNRISAQQIMMQTKTATTTTYPANEIPQFAFCNPTSGNGKLSLKSIVLPNSTTSIGNYAFRYCTGLTSITIPSSVTTIGNYAFYNCTGLNSITLPASVISIGEGAFLRCGLINVDNGNPNYSSQEGVLYNKLKTQIIQCPTVKTGSFSILNSVISIGISAFESCTGLTSITIPASVSYIENYAFYYCSGLSSITIPASVTSIGKRAFYYCGLINVDNGNPNYSSQEGVLYNKLKTQIIQCPTVKIGSFSIPNSVTLIGDYAFFYCNGLTSITIPLNVTYIGNYAFYYCTGLNSITIPASVTSIGNNAFYRCTSLTSITIPLSVSSIGNNAFAFCTGLTSIYANSIIPIDLTNKYSVFFFIDNSTCTLYVPQGSKAAYQAAEQWKDFTNIVEFTPAATETLLTNLEYPKGLCLNGDKIYLTETAARNTSYGGKLCLDKYDILTKQKTILKNNPICSDALVATNDNKLYLSSYVGSIPGESGKISVYDLTSNTESLFLNIEIATNDMYLNTNGDILIIGMSDLVDAKSIYKLAIGNYNSPIILKTGLGRVTSITESNNRIYFSSYHDIKYFDSDGIVQTLLSNHGAYSISCSQDYLYYADVNKNTIGRVHLSTMVDEVLLTNLNSPIAVRYDNSTNKLYFLESGTNSGLYKDGTLKVLTITPTGIKNVTVNSISISPNPAKSYLKVTTSEIINRIVVYDISGRIVQNIIVGTNSYTLNVNNLLNGIYLIKGFTDRGIITSRFIKE